MLYTGSMKYAALSNQVWITELEESHSNYLLRVGQLRNIILNSLSKAFRKNYRIGHDLLEDITHDSVMKILKKKRLSEANPVLLHGQLK